MDSPVPELSPAAGAAAVFAVSLVLFSAAVNLPMAVIRNQDSRVNSLSVTIEPGAPPCDWSLSPPARPGSLRGPTFFLRSRDSRIPLGRFRPTSG